MMYRAEIQFCGKSILVIKDQDGTCFLSPAFCENMIENPTMSMSEYVNHDAFFLSQMTNDRISCMGYVSVFAAIGYWLHEAAQGNSSAEALVAACVNEMLQRQLNSAQFTRFM
jgi:hypothetical protein